MKNQPAHSSGFTLIELMITIIIAAILFSIAIPSFTDTIAANRLTTSANELVTALNLARSEAIKRGMQVTIRNKGAATQWESGWDVFVDIDGNGNWMMLIQRPAKPTRAESLFALPRWLYPRGTYDVVAYTATTQWTE